MFTLCNYCKGIIPYGAHNCSGCGAFTAYPQHTVTSATQKAKGLLALHAMGVGYSEGITVLPIYGLLSVKEPLTKPPAWSFKPSQRIFARPCPPNPEHGFVESREIKSWEELEALRQETFAVCEDAEIMLTPLIQAAYNALWTPQLLTVGPDHDGATAGKNCINLPLMGMSTLSPAVCKNAGIAEGKGPYIEAVYDSQQCHLTQLRGGPILESSQLDCIPRRMKVKTVRKTNGEDLLEWAKVIKMLPRGTAVWHPGGSPTDHYSVHCRENKVPICITFEPQVGKMLVPTKKIEDLDPIEMLRGAAVVDRLDLYPHASRATILALVALHNSGAIRGTNSFWHGAAASILIKLGSAALHGEARHAAGRNVNKNRSDQHKFHAGQSLAYSRARLSRVTKLLYYGFGDPKVSHSFGGPNWALCGASLVPLYNGLRQLALEPTAAHASELLQALNIAINQAHNGGWWLNKFVDGSAYVDIPKGSFTRILQIGPMLPLLWNRRAEIDLELFIKRVQAWPVTGIRPLKFRKAGMTALPSGTFVLHLKAANVPSPLVVPIPLSTGMQNTLMHKKIGRVDIKPGKVELVLSDKTYELWKEEPLKIEARKVGS